MQARYDETTGETKPVDTRYEPETPFLDRFEPVPEADTDVRNRLTSSVWQQMETPFTSFYEAGEDAEGGDPKQSFYVQLLGELHDETFEDAINELVQEAAAVYEDRFNQELGDPVAQRMAAENMVRDYLAPLARDAENLVDSVAQGLAEHDLSVMTEDELETVLNQYEPMREDLSPAFEGFLKGVWKKVKKVAKGVAAVAKKGISLATKLATFPLNIILPKLKKLLRPLLERVLKVAIGKLPPPLQPAAQLLARKFLGTGISEEAFEGEDFEEYAEQSEAAVPGLSGLQNEMDVHLVNSLMEGESMEEEMASAEYANPSSYEEEDHLEVLSEARERFVDRYNSLQENEDPQPALEEFIPAILPALSLGVRLIGRPRVVGFLAKPLAGLIAKLVGPQVAEPLSRAIVDAGLRLISFETTPEQEARAAGSAMAATVEETIQRVTTLPDEVLEDRELLEASLQEVFEEALASNFPSPRLKPQLRQSSSPGTWVMMPVASPRKAYKKYTVIFDKTIPPHTLARVKSFGGVPLASILRDQYGLDPKKEHRARIHLYEAISGTRLGRITARERNVRGLGSATASARTQMHPLTPEAAGALLGDPGLGKAVDPQYLHDRRHLQLGQRFFYLEIDGARVVAPTGRIGGAHIRRSSRTQVTIDCPGNRIGVAVYLSEEDANQVRKLLNDRTKPPSAWLSALNGVFGPMSGNLLAGRGVRIKHESAAYEEFIPLIVGAAAVRAAMKRRARAKAGKTARFEGVLGRGSSLLRRMPGGFRARIATRILNWCRSRVLQFLKTRKDEFLRALAHPADGVTILITFANPPLIAAMCNVLKRKSPVTSAEAGEDEMPSAHIQVVPGFTQG
jgi:hypothetical protein